MDNMNIKDQIDAITKEKSLSIDERINKVMELIDNLPDSEKEKEKNNDILIFTSLVEMVNEDPEKSSYSDLLLQFYSYLVQAYSDNRDYRPIKHLAIEVLELMRHDELSWDDLEEYLPEILDALDDTVYHHLLFEMLVLFLNASEKAGALNKEMKGWIRKTLKLKILLPDTIWCGYMLDKNLKEPIARLMTSDELLKIILHPDLGNLKRDPVEYSLEWEDIYYDLEDELENRFANAPRGHGFCFYYWNAMKELLKDKYDITWRSPSQMNPRIKFD